MTWLSSKHRGGKTQRELEAGAAMLSVSVTGTESATQHSRVLKGTHQHVH